MFIIVAFVGATSSGVIDVSDSWGDYILSFLLVAVPAFAPLGLVVAAWLRNSKRLMNALFRRGDRFRLFILRPFEYDSVLIFPPVEGLQFAADMLLARDAQQLDIRLMSVLRTGLALARIGLKERQLLAAGHIDLRDAADEEWQAAMRDISARADLILVVPIVLKPDNGLDWEIGYLRGSGMLDRTIFVMPAQSWLDRLPFKRSRNVPSEWRAARERLRSAHDIELPAYRDTGGFVLPIRGRWRLAHALSGGDWGNARGLRRFFERGLLRRSLGVESLVFSAMLHTNLLIGLLLTLIAIGAGFAFADTEQAGMTTATLVGGLGAFLTIRGVWRCARRRARTRGQGLLLFGFAILALAIGAVTVVFVMTLLASEGVLPPQPSGVMENDDRITLFVVAIWLAVSATALYVLSRAVAPWVFFPATPDEPLLSRLRMGAEASPSHASDVR